jgi:hypothetical protein
MARLVEFEPEADAQMEKKGFNPHVVFCLAGAKRSGLQQRRDTSSVPREQDLRVGGPMVALSSSGDGL